MSFGNGTTIVLLPRGRLVELSSEPATLLPREKDFVCSSVFPQNLWLMIPTVYNKKT